ncbi:hypothetical protein [Bosea sp. NPDC055594]
MAEQPITHARFAEIVANMSSYCAQWAGSCLTLPEKVSEPMTAWSLKRFIDEMQQRIDFLREDLDTAGAAEIRAKSALENGPAGLADAHSKSSSQSSQSERIAVLEAALREKDRVVQLYGKHDKMTDREKLGAIINHPSFARAALDPLAEE